MTKLWKVLAFSALVFALLAAPVAGLAGSNAQPAGKGEAQPIVREATRTDTTAPLAEKRPNPPRAGELLELPRKMLPNRPGAEMPPAVDPVLQEGVLPDAATTLANFEGINNIDGVLPPDTVGDVGPNHYVQMVNLSFAVYDKSGARLYGPAATSTLWQNFGGPCESTNDGDPVVLYDHLADRWVMSQFALPNYPYGPFYECIAVSQTSSPLGSWHRYEFLISNTKMDDYPKLGVWPDGYYMTVNQFQQATLGWAGAGAVAFERDKMLLGQPARMVYFDLANVDMNLGGMLPSDLDGQAPPAGAPNVFAQFDDNAWGYSGDQVQLWKFSVNWATPTASTFTFDKALPVAAFDSNMCNGSRNCIPQPGGRAVDAIADRLMFRLQYRNFGGYQTLVTNHTVDVNGSDRAGVRWYELRDSGSGWGVYQQGTFSPDANHRWMASAAMNGAGQLALGYSISSTTVNPSIRFTGRMSGDPLGQMTQGEGTIVNGTGYQGHSSGRWGDYSTLSVDPTDDCTFWYTQEYYTSTTRFGAAWQTRIGSFKLADCSGNPPPPTDSLHVGDLDGSGALTGATWTASVTVAVHNSSHAPVSGATVTGSWSNGGASTCTTNASGVCTLSKTKIRKINSVTFTVTGVSGALAYSPALNHDPDGDSNGTAITVNRP